MVLYGWAFHIELFLSVFSGFVSMKANTALGLALSGMSLWLLLPSDATVGRRRLGRLLALFVVMLGACTLAEYVFGFDLAIDQLLFNEPVGAIATYAPGRMAPTSTTAFIAIGLSLLILDRKTRGGRAAQVLSLWAVLIAVLAIIGYMYHATALYRLLLSTQVAVHTAVTFFLLGTAIFFARPQQGIAGEITGNAAGSIMARRFLPAVVLIPISLGWMGLRGELAGLYRTEFGLALYASVSVLLFATLIWSNARKMNGECDQRSQAEVALRDLNADLEGRVADRTSALEQYAAVLAEQAALLDLAPDAIVVGDMQSRVLFWNRGAETIYGWSGREALGRHSTDLLKTEFFQPAEIVRAELLSDAHWEGDAVQYKRDGTRMIVASRSALQRDAEGTPIRILTINNDITHRRQAEARLAMLTDRLSLAAAVAKMGVWEWELASNEVTWDNTMLEMYGFPRADSITYENWYAAVWPEDRAQAEAALRKVVDEKGNGVMEFRILRQDGSLRNISGAFRAIFNDTSKAGRVIGVNVDITERKQAEEALEQSRQTQLRFKDEFYPTSLMRFGLPLFAIMQFTTIMLDGLAG